MGSPDRGLVRQLLAEHASHFQRLLSHAVVNSRQKKTLQGVFAQPTAAGLAWSDIESLLIALGCKTIDGSGSRVRFVCRNVVASFHHPHPVREARPFPFLMES
jgi:hypothetical protein